jgi:hypothetical protein
VSWPTRPVIHEVNTWPWLHDVGVRAGRTVTLADVPADAWDAVCVPGVDTVWLMGVWDRSPASREIALADPGNVASFEAALPDLDPDADVVGSAYSVRRFVVDERLGGRDGLAAARAELRRRGVRLLLDFVPNHVAPDHPWTEEHPEYFMPGTDGARYAAGRDPYFPPWDDTVQLNAFSMALRSAAIATVMEIAEQCDGVRCDMAMLLLNRVFTQTWGDRAGWPPPTEYWTDVIGAVRAAHPGFVFMAEAYWELEHELQLLGFDFCYDKRLYDRLESGDARAIGAHLGADLDYQNGLVRFLENHDEPRAAATFEPERERAAAVAIATLPGATLWHEGQFDGRRVRPPVFLTRRPTEAADPALREFYLQLVADDVRAGQWERRDAIGWDDNPSAMHLLAWSWTDGQRRAVAVVNWSPAPAQGRVLLPWDDLDGRSLTLTDVLTGTCYDRDGGELQREGLYVDRPGWGAHVFAVKS